jgi:hypothetical protein
MNKFTLLTIIYMALLSGCSRYDMGQIQVSELSADERIVFTKNSITCAEPSPDAIKSISQAFSGNVFGYGELSSSFATSVASIGVRTASLQILRDIGYRVCEGLANGVIDEHHYHEIVHGVDDAAVALMAVEGLTGINQAPSATTSSSGSASTTSSDTSSGTTAATPAASTSSSPTVDKPQPTSEQAAAVASKVVEIVNAVIAANPKDPATVALDKGHASH